MKIAVAGKGGTGKTTFVSLLLRILLNEGETPILAIDADPNSNLDELLGLSIVRTIADIREEMKDENAIPKFMSKHEYFKMKLEELIIESSGFDFISMGRPEGPGCYCFVNELLRFFLKNISNSYRYTLIDNEAGLEHLSRRTTDEVDILFILSEPSHTSLLTATRIKETAQKLNLKISEIYLIINKLKNDVIKNEFTDKFDKIDYIHYNGELAKIIESGKNIFLLPENNYALKEVEKIVKSALLWKKW